MARKEKFALDMGGGKEVRSLEELQEAFDIDRVIGYFQDGSLLTWLDDRYYDEAAEAIDGLSMTDPQFNEKLCAALGVEYKGGGLDPEDVKILQEKTEKLKKYNPSENVLANACRTAFTQEDLADLLDRGEETIFLCGPTFTIPARVKNKEYIGIFEKPTIKISVTDPAVLAERGITFSNVTLAEGLASAVKDGNANLAGKKRSIPDEELMALFRATIHSLGTWVAVRPKVGVPGADYVFKNPKDDTKTMILRLAGAKNVSEEDILFGLFSEDATHAWILTKDSFFYFADGKKGHVHYDSLIQAEVIEPEWLTDLMKSLKGNPAEGLKLHSNMDERGNLMDTWTDVPYMCVDENGYVVSIAKFLNGVASLLHE